jgi:hypothetical protein
MGIFYLWEWYMDQTITQRVGERKRLLAALDKLSRDFDQTLQNLIDEKPPSTEAPPIQLELPLEWSHHNTQEHLLKVLEPCTKAMQSQS